jgi:D-alanine-D-alanine ligase
MSAVPVADPELEASLRDVSARFFAALGGTSYGRCDIRVDDEGTPWMLEINPNCGVFFPATDYGSGDLCLANDPAGHEGFTRQIVAAALKRHEMLNE